MYVGTHYSIFSVDVPCENLLSTSRARPCAALAKDRAIPVLYLGTCGMDSESDMAFSLFLSTSIPFVAAICRRVNSFNSDCKRLMCASRAVLSSLFVVEDRRSVELAMSSIFCEPIDA